jgi:outer membrane protein insertion porin family
MASARAILAPLLAALCTLSACRAAPPQAEHPSGPELVLEGLESVEPERARAVAAAELARFFERSSRRGACDDAAYALERFLRSEGHSVARVDWRLEEIEPDRSRVILLVREGPRTRIRQVDLAEPGTLGRKQVLDILSARLGQDLEAGTARFVEERLREALDDLRATLSQRGHLQAEVDYVVQHLDREGAAVDLELRLREGPRFVLRGVRLQRASTAAEAPSDAQSLEGPAGRLDTSDLLGRALTPEALQTVRARLIELYEGAGFPDVRVEDGVLVNVDPASPGSVELAIGLEPGERVRIGRIQVRGNQRTRESRIRAALSLSEGERWSGRALRESFRELSRSGLFARIDLRLEPTTGPVRDLVVEVEEVPSREFYLEPGYGSYERARLGAGWSERNLLGTGRSLDAKGSLSEFAQSASLALTDRRLFDLPLQGSLSVFANAREEPSFQTENVGTGWTLTRRLDEQRELGFSYQYRRSDVFGADLTDPDAQDLLDDVDISSVAVSFVRDTRNDPFGPSRGSLGRVWLEYGDGAIGSELDFARLRVLLARFVALSERTVLGLSWRAGAIAPHGSTAEIPLQERFFNGGENTVRSFEESELGAKDSNGEPLGGEGFQVGSLELRRRLRGNWEVALFYDGGNLVEQADELLELEGLRHALGVGLRYHLPVGPIRLDWGVNPDPAEDESESVLHFSIGMSF